VPFTPLFTAESPSRGLLGVLNLTKHYDTHVPQQEVDAAGTYLLMGITFLVWPKWIEEVNSREVLFVVRDQDAVI
jgi:hypothetical protein